jgi:GPI mannosyltransferase 2
VVVSSFCHLLSVLLVYKFTNTLFSQVSPRTSSFPIAAAALHIINPAGAFLLSTYSEGLFSFLNILGCHLYLNWLLNHYNERSFRGDTECLAAGAVLGLATTVRSNGLLSGTLFIYDAVVTLKPVLNCEFKIENFKRLVVLVVSGCLVALGGIIPQYRVYSRYCDAEAAHEIRPWCSNYVPSIYAWVQNHYWYEKLTLFCSTWLLTYRTQECWPVSVLDYLQRTIIPTCCPSNLRPVQVLHLDLEGGSWCCR